nr:GFA family protein [Chthonobacter albigriseus]
MGRRIHGGGCLCGSVRFEVSGPLEKPHTCSCSICRRHSGALTVAWVECAKERVQWTGPGGEPAVYRTSDWSSRAFCPRCGSTIGAIDDAPVVALVVGAFDRPALKDFVPTSHSYRSARPRWWHVEISGGKANREAGGPVSRAE